MSELVKSFEQDFPLPFHIEEDETGQLRTLCPASGTAFMDFGIVEGPLDFDGYDVQEYLVKCANLMPEAITLFGIIEEVLTLCATRTFDAETKHLLSHTAKTVQTFKKKLEGGAEDA